MFFSWDQSAVCFSNETVLERWGSSTTCFQDLDSKYWNSLMIPSLWCIPKEGGGLWQGKCCYTQMTDSPQHCYATPWCGRLVWHWQFKFTLLISESYHFHPILIVSMTCKVTAAARTLMGVIIADCIPKNLQCLSCLWSQSSEISSAFQKNRCFLDFHNAVSDICIEWVN